MEYFIIYVPHVVSHVWRKPSVLNKWEEQYLRLVLNHVYVYTVEPIDIQSATTYVHVHVFEMEESRSRVYFD